MSDTSEQPWSNHPNAPQIPSWLYLGEKDFFAGRFIGAISYGIVITLFFQCMGVLLSPANLTKKAIKWALVVHTMAMFMFITIPIGIDFKQLSTDYIDGREYSGNDEFPPGPLGNDIILGTVEIEAVSNIMFPLNQWLADGLLLHRCYVIYSMNHWAMAFPCVMYIASVAMGSAYVYERSKTAVFTTVTAINYNTSYLSICLSLSILLTLMIVTRLILHRRTLRRALGTSDGAGGVYTTIAAMLIESYALYAVALLAYTIPWAINSWAISIFKAVGAVQVIAPYLIIIRVAKRKAVTSESISGSFESIRFRSQGSMDGDEPFPDGGPTNATGVNSEAPGEPGARDENAIEEVPL